MRFSTQTSQQLNSFKRYNITKEMSDSQALPELSRDPINRKVEQKAKISDEASRIQPSAGVNGTEGTEVINNDDIKSQTGKKELSNLSHLNRTEDAEDKQNILSQSRALLLSIIEGKHTTKSETDLHLKQAVNIQPQKASRQKSILSQATKEYIKPIEQSSDLESQKEEFKRPKRKSDSANPQKDDKNSIQCFRCGNRGHIAKNCFQQMEKTKCMYCLGDHHHLDCNARACFRCNQLGHVALECKNNAVQCHKCKKRGHIQKHCGTVLVMDYTKFPSDKEYRQYYGEEDLKKLRCLNNCKDPFGHFNCFEYKDDRKKPYQKEETKHKKAVKGRERQRDRQRDRQRERQKERERQQERGKERSGHKNRDCKASNSLTDPSKIAHQNNKYSSMAFSSHQMQVQPQLNHPQQFPPAIMQPQYMNFGYPNMPMNNIPQMGQPQPTSSAPYFNPYPTYPPYAPPHQNFQGEYSYSNDPYGRPMPQRGPYQDYQHSFDHQNPQKW